MHLNEAVIAKDSHKLIQFLRLKSHSASQFIVFETEMLDPSRKVEEGEKGRAMSFD